MLSFIIYESEKDMSQEILNQLQKCKSILIELKAWLKNNKTSSRIRSIMQNDRISNDLFILSKMLNIENNLQLLYHIKYQFIEIPRCESCLTKNKKYGGKQYNFTCGNKLCSINLRIKRTTETKSVLDENGKSIAQYAKIKSDIFMKNTIDKSTGKTLHQLRSEKIKNSLSKIDPITGLSGYKKIGITAGYTKKITILENGLSIAQNSRKIQIEQYKNNMFMY